MHKVFPWKPCSVLPVVYPVLLCAVTTHTLSPALLLTLSLPLSLWAPSPRGLSVLPDSLPLQHMLSLLDKTSLLTVSLTDSYLPSVTRTISYADSES